MDLTLTIVCSENSMPHYEKHDWGPLKTKTGVTLWSRNPTPGKIFRKDESCNLKNYVGGNIVQERKEKIIMGKKKTQKNPQTHKLGDANHISWLI